MGWCTKLLGLLVLLACLVVYVGNTPPCISLMCRLTLIGCPPESTVKGFIAPGFQPVLEAFLKNFEEGKDIGAHVTVYHKGVVVVDIAAGYADKDHTIPYQLDTTQIIFSSTKVFESLAIAMLVDRGLLDYSKTVATYWPEFARNGKGAVTVGDLMSHGGGVAWLDQAVPHEKFYDLGKAADILAKTHLADDAWRQKGNQCYHALTRGFFASQLVHRVDPHHRFMDAFVQDEIMRPLGLEGNFTMQVIPGNPRHADIHARMAPIIVPPKHRMLNMMGRLMLPAWLADLLFTEGAIPASVMENFAGMMQPDSNFDKAWRVFAGDDFMFHKMPGLTPFMRSDIMRIEGPSYSGVTHAGVMAKVANVLAHKGSFDGVTLLSPRTLEMAETLFPVALDQCVRMNITYSLGGWGRIVTNEPSMNTDATMGWAGAGGSLMQWSHDKELAFAYTMNFYDGHERGVKILNAALSALDAGQKQTGSNRAHDEV